MDVLRTIPQYLIHWAEKTPESPFVALNSTWFTYGEIESQANDLAWGLSKLGLSKGDRVAVVLPNCVEMILTLFAMFKRGIVAVPLNTYLRGEFLKYQLQDSGAKVVIGDELAFRELSHILADIPDFKHIVVVRKASCSPSMNLPDHSAVVHDFSDLFAGDKRTTSIDLNADNLAAILYTSGTTGMPKGCMVSHAYCMGRARPWYRAEWIRPRDVLLTPMPLFHGGALFCALIPSLYGGLSACFDEGFSASHFMQRAKSMSATYAWLPGPMAMAMLKTERSEADRDHQLERLALNPMQPIFQAKFEERFGVRVLTRVYGQTEIVPAALGSWLPNEVGRTTSGEAVDDVEIQIVDDHDTPVPCDTIGEIVIRPRGPEGIFQGYWNKPEDTLKAFKNLWHHTGDLGSLSKDGVLRFFDRKKDSIRRRGENVSAFELERAIGTHEAVVSVAVHAVPSPLGEDEIKACVVLKPNASVTPEELFSFLKERVPYFAVPHYVEVMSELPTNAMGRVMKSALRERGIGNAWDFEKLGLTIDKSERRG